MRRSRRLRQGGALLLVLSVLAGLVALTATFAASQMAEFRARQNRSDQRHADLMADAGLDRALAQLSQPFENPGFVTTLDEWAQLGQKGADRFLVGPSWFRLEIVDAGALVNLNTAAQDQLMKLPLTTEQVDSLLDWRSDDDQGRPEGAKDPYYNSLDNPYNAALHRIETLDEIFLIKGFSGAALYQPQTDTVNTQFIMPGTQENQPVLGALANVRSGTPDLGPGGTAKLNINTATTPQLVQRGIPQPLALAIIQRRNTTGTFPQLGAVFLTPGMNMNVAAIVLDNFRVGNAATAEGRINLNTASEPVLNTIPGFSPDVASGVLSRQQTGFAALSEITQIPGITLDVLRQCADSITVGSDTFIVRVIGGYGRAQSVIEATVSLQNGQPVVLHRWRPPTSDILTLWQWSAETTSEIDLGVAQ